MYEINDKLYVFLKDLPSDVLLNVMLSALDEMQSYNGRTMTRCIMQAMDAKKINDNKWEAPSKDEIIKKFS